MTHQKQIRNPAITLAAILLCLVLITTYMTSGLYAKFTTSSSAGDSARVATFAIETDLDHIRLGASDTPLLELGGEDEIESVDLPFYITSASEVEAQYGVTVKFGSALPDYMILTLTNGEKSVSLAANGSKTEFVFSEFGSLAAGGEEVQREDLMLSLSISDLTLVTEETSIPTAELTVRVYQAD